MCPSGQTCVRRGKFPSLTSKHCWLAHSTNTPNRHLTAEPLAVVPSWNGRHYHDVHNLNLLAFHDHCLHEGGWRASLFQRARLGRHSTIPPSWTGAIPPPLLHTASPRLCRDAAALPQSECTTPPNIALAASAAAFRPLAWRHRCHDRSMLRA